MRECWGQGFAPFDAGRIANSIENFTFGRLKAPWFKGPKSVKLASFGPSKVLNLRDPFSLMI